MSSLKTSALMVAIFLCLTPQFNFADKILKCADQCDCEIKEEKEYRIICNKLGPEPTKLTEEIFATGPGNSTDIPMVYIRIENGGHVTVTHGFINAWKEYSSCSLDVWDVHHFVLPSMNSHSHKHLSGLSHVFAGIGIEGSTVSEIPNYLFSGKHRAGLRLVDTTAGIIQPRVFGKVKVLKYWDINRSNVGIIKGSSNANQLIVDVKSIAMQNSAIGHIETGALNLTSNTKKHILMKNMTIGRIDTNGIVTSKMDLLLLHSSVANMQPEALKPEVGDSIQIKNNYVISQPGAMTHLKCSYSDHHISKNEIVVPYISIETSKEHSSNTDDNDTEVRTSPFSYPRQSTPLANTVAEKLSTVLHPSCIQYNIPKWASINNCAQKQKQTSHLVHLGLYIFIGISIVAVLIAVVLTCILINIKGRRRPHVETPPVILSQLHDPVYEDAPTFFVNSAPPPVPPPVRQPLIEGKASCSSNQNSGTFCGNSCQSETGSSSRMENPYVPMR